MTLPTRILTKKLTWKDFKAEPNQKSDAVALTASGITFGFSQSKICTDWTVSLCIWNNLDVWCNGII